MRSVLTVSTLPEMKRFVLRLEPKWLQTISIYLVWRKLYVDFCNLRHRSHQAPNAPIRLEMESSMFNLIFMRFRAFSLSHPEFLCMEDSTWHREEPDRNLNLRRSRSLGSGRCGSHLDGASFPVAPHGAHRLHGGQKLPPSAKVMCDRPESVRKG